MQEDLVLDKNRRRVKECPCGKSNKGGRWVPYVGHDNFGWCHDCETLFLPDKESTKDSPIKNSKQKYIDPSVVIESQQNLSEDTFFKAFRDIFSSDSELLSHMKRMNMGTDREETIYWNVDKYGRVSSLKRFKYNSDGTRDKTFEKHESYYKIANGYYPGLFNAHALSNKDKTVVLVEAEKTAVLASYLFPNYVWVASGGKNLSYDKAIELKGRNIIFLCDADEEGRSVIPKMQDLFKKVGDCKFVSYDLFPERIDGYDVADLISDRRNDLAVPESIVTGVLQRLEDEIVPKGDKIEDIIFSSSIEEAEELIFEGKIDRGETTHFYEMDRLLKWKRGFVYSLVGYSNMGKSEFLKFLMVLKAVKDDWKICMFCPEDMISVGKKESPLGIENALIQMMTGRPLDKEDAMCLSREKYREALSFIKEHFYIIYPDNGYPTQDNLMSQLQKIVDYGIKLDAVVVDPFNNLRSDQKAFELLDAWQVGLVKKAKSFAIKNDLCWIYAMHPPKMKKNPDGTISTPEFDEARGGAAFGNASDFFIAYNRPQFFVDNEIEYKGKVYQNGKVMPLTEINVRKVKNRDLIKCYPGFIQIDYEGTTRRYLNDFGKSPLDPVYSKDMKASDAFSTQKFPSIKKDDVIHLFDSIQNKKVKDDLDDDLPF